MALYIKLQLYIPNKKTSICSRKIYLDSFELYSIIVFKLIYSGKYLQRIKAKYYSS